MKADTFFPLMGVLALSACSEPARTDQAQTPAAAEPMQTQPAAQAPGIEVSTEGGMTTITTAGNLQSTFDIGCIDMAQVKNVYSPADLFKGSVACFQAGDGARGVNLFSLALAYGRYDIDRVADRTAHQGLEVLKLSSFEPFSEADKTLISEQIGAFVSSPETRRPFCAQLRALGPPDYHPDYMIQHGIQAFQPWAAEGVNGLLADFDPVASWQMVVEKYMKCSTGADPAAAPASDQGADTVAAGTQGDSQAQLDEAAAYAAEKLRDAPMFASTMKMAVAEHYRAVGAWPESNAELGMAEATPQMPATLGKGGVITIRLEEPELLAGKSIMLTPRAEASGDWVNVLWDCAAVDIPPELRSQDCP